MRAVIQRVASAGVEIDGEVVSEIDEGILLLLGIAEDDTEKELNYIYEKTVNLRIFEDDNQKMNLSLKDIEGSILVVSQFTVCGDTSKGRRPNFSAAAKPDKAEPMYEEFISKCKQDPEIKNVGTGKFGADMKVNLVNDGPVTIIIDSK